MGDVRVLPRLETPPPVKGRQPRFLRREPAQKALRRTKKDAVLSASFFVRRRNARCACVGAALSAALLLISQEHEKQGDSTDDGDKRHQDQPDRKFQVIQTADTEPDVRKKQGE